MAVGFEIQAGMISIHFTATYDAYTSCCVFINRVKLVFDSS